MTLKGNIEFKHTSEYGDLALFYENYSDETFESQVDLNLENLATNNLNMYVPSAEYVGTITCDADYSAKLKARATKYAVYCEKADDGKYVVKFNERKIKTQPTMESPKVEVSDDTGVSFQWYKAGEKNMNLTILV